MTARWKFVEISRCWLRKSELCVCVTGRVVFRRHSETNTVQFLPACLLALRFVFVPLIVSVISHPSHVSVKSYNQQITTSNLIVISNILNSFVTFLVFLMVNLSENWNISIAAKIDIKRRYFWFSNKWNIHCYLNTNYGTLFFLRWHIEKNWSIICRMSGLLDLDMNSKDNSNISFDLNHDGKRQII